MLQISGIHCCWDKPPNRIKAHPTIVAQSHGYDFPDILEAHPIPNKNKTDNFKKFW